MKKYSHPLTSSGSLSVVTGTWHIYKLSLGCGAVTFLWTQNLSLWRTHYCHCIEVDCTQNRMTCSKYGVRGYPTILWLTNGERSEDYRGQRSIEDLTRFVTKMTSEESETAKTSNDGTVPDILKDEPEVGVVALNDEDFKESVSEDFTFVVFDNDVTRTEAVMPTLEKLAERYVTKPELLVATIDCKKNADTCKSQDANGPYPQYQLYHNGAAIVSYEGEKTVVAIETYINEMMKKYGKDHDEL